MHVKYFSGDNLKNKDESQNLGVCQEKKNEDQRNNKTLRNANFFPYIILVFQNGFYCRVIVTNCTEIL